MGIFSWYLKDYFIYYIRFDYKKDTASQYEWHSMSFLECFGFLSQNATYNEVFLQIHIFCFYVFMFFVFGQSSFTRAEV